MKKRYLFLFLISGLVLMNACLKEHSLENGNSPSEGTLQDDGTGDCFPKTVSGAYVIGTALVGTSNYIDVQVNVTLAGSFSIYTDTVNGMYFRASGIFTNTGLNTVRLKGNGTPVAIGISNFIVNYGSSGCTVAVTVVGSLAVFSLNGSPGSCMGAVTAGTYTVGTALNASNIVTINVNVTTIGAYNIATTVSNGMTFTGSGTFSATGAQSIVLTGSGTPVSAGSTNIPVTAGSSSCGFPVTVVGGAGAAVYVVNCGSATINGTYTQNTALAATNTVTIGVNVTTIGGYTITTTTTSGMTFSATGNFTATGVQNVTLTGTGTPTASGAISIPVPSGTTPCNFTVNVQPAAGSAVFVVNCGSAVVNGTYTQNTALTATNTVTVGVNVTTIGTYTITTTTTSGMTFTATGSFAATGVQNVTLAGSGTPAASGAISIPVPSGTTPCNFTVNVQPAAGAATFVVNCASAVVTGTYIQNTPLGGANSVAVGVNVTTIGTYTITTTTTSGMTFTATGNFSTTGVQNVTLFGSGTPTASGAISIPVPSGTTPCNFTVNVQPPAGGPATFSVNCASAVANGTYTVGTALTAANTVTIGVNVTTAGTYTITTTATNGMTFSASGTFGTTGIQNVTLTGTGNPTTSGANSIPVPSGTTPCNFTVNVNAAGGPAVFAVNCGSAVVNGTYLINTALTASNTVTISVNVTTIGTYTITTTTTSGMTFSKSGTFAATGVQSVTLVGTGTPTAGGTITIPVPSGTTPCTFDVDVFIGTWSFTEGANNFSGFIDDAEWDLTSLPPFLILYFSGPTAAGHYFEIDLLDVSTTINANETYNAAVFTGAANSGLIYMEDLAGNILYQADPSPTGIPNTMIMKVTSHSVPTKTVIGTFSGNVLDGANNTKVITNGNFKVTYP